MLVNLNLTTITVVLILQEVEEDVEEEEESHFLLEITTLIRVLEEGDVVEVEEGDVVEEEGDVGGRLTSKVATNVIDKRSTSIWFLCLDTCFFIHPLILLSFFVSFILSFISGGKGVRGKVRGGEGKERKGWGEWMSFPCAFLFYCKLIL